jgi:hypothetical protein
VITILIFQNVFFKKEEMLADKNVPTESAE